MSNSNILQASVSERSDGGGITRLMRRLFSRSGRMAIGSSRVASIEYPSPNFALLRLEGDAFKNRPWTPGDKIQIGVAAGPVGRTYTPLSWNSERGVVEVLIYLHGDAPGCRWARHVTVGESFEYVGPRSSIDLSVIRTPAALFGDETCFGLAIALHNSPAGRAARYMFEVSDVAQARSVLNSFGLKEAMLCERSSEGSHLAAVEAELRRISVDTASLVLAGKASSIQFVQRANKAAGATISQVKAKAYWAPGKTGLG